MRRLLKKKKEKLVFVDELTRGKIILKFFNKIRNDGKYIEIDDFKNGKTYFLDSMLDVVELCVEALDNERKKLVVDENTRNQVIENFFKQMQKNGKTIKILDSKVV